MRMARFLFLFAPVLASGAKDESGPVRIRELAGSMLKKPRLGGEGAYCEYAPISQVHGCSGPNRNEYRHVARPNGLIETWLYRSPGESGDPIGHYKGQLRKGEWRSLLKSIARMGRDRSSANAPLPPPGPLESVPYLRLSDGRDSATFSLAGHAPESIENAFDRLDILAQSERDTVWELSLTEETAQVRKDSVVITARWRWRGPTGARVLFSDSAGGAFCGKAGFKWHSDTSAFGVEWHPSRIASESVRNPVWNLKQGLSAPFSLVFPFEGVGKSKRTGQVDGMGIRLVVPGEKDTLSATVFSKQIDF